jgi:hypothetical protein
MGFLLISEYPHGIATTGYYGVGLGVSHGDENDLQRDAGSGKDRLCKQGLTEAYESIE